MVSLFQWLQDEKNYTSAESSETVDRYFSGLNVPSEIMKDISDYHRQNLSLLIDHYSSDNRYN